MFLRVLFLSCCILWQTALFAQNCPTSIAGTLVGGQQTVVISDTIPAAVYATTPSGLPHTEFLILLQDSLATDGLGAPVLTVSLDGRFVPHDYGLGLCNNVCILPFSYDLGALQNIVDSVLYADFFPGTTCCSALGGVVAGLCDSITARGITRGSDLQDLNDVLNFFSIFTGTTDAPSTRGVVNAIVSINNFLNLGGNCAAGVQEICYAVNFNDTARTCYHVIQPGAARQLLFYPLNNPVDTLFVLAGQSFPLPTVSTYLPNSSSDSIFWYLASSSTAFSIDGNGNLLAPNQADTVAVVAQTHNSCLRDTLWFITTTSVDVQQPRSSPTEVQIFPQPFHHQLTVLVHLPTAQEIQLRLLHPTGQVVLEQTHSLAAGKHHLFLPTVDVPAGTYWLQWIGDEQSFERVVVKQ